MKGTSAAIKVGIVVLLVAVASYGTYKAVSEKASGDGAIEYFARFRDASGLANKARVVIAGLTIGDITDARLDGNLARVTVGLKKGTLLYKNAAISKKSSSLLGEYYLEIDPGTAEVPGPDGKFIANPLLEPGSEIKTVIEAKSAGDLINDMGRVLPRVDEVLVEIRGLAADARKILNTSVANIARNVDKLVEDNVKVIDSILGRVDRIAEDIEDITGTSGDEVKRILASVERSAYELEDLLKTTKGEIQLTGKEVRDRLERIDRSIAALEETLEGTASIANKIDDNEGTLGRLVNDPAIADNVEQITEDVKGFTGGLFSLQTLVGIRSEANLFAQLTRETVWVELHTKNDKYYLFEVVSDTRGSIEQTYAVDDATGQLVRTQTVEPYGIRFSFMFAKRLGWATFRVGVKESTGGVGFDADLFGGRGKLSLDVFDFQWDKYPRMRLTTAWNFYKYLYLYAGVDDVLNKFQEIPVVGDNLSGGSPATLPFGRDVFVGLGIRFTDEDLRTLLFIGGGAIAALAGNYVKITIVSYLDEETDKTFDAVVPQVAKALRKLGHAVSTLGVHGDVKKLIGGLTRRKPDLIFNLMEMWREDLTGDIPVVGLFDLLGLKYTGSGPGELYLTQDKALGKKILAFDGISFPRFAVFSKNADFETGGNLKMPLFVKPLRMDASIGIDAKALVGDAITLMKRVVHIHDELGDAALAEEYIEGREFYVGIVGNQNPLALPPIEVDFSGLPEGAPHVLDNKAKWDDKSKEYKGTRSVIAQIPDELRARLHKVSLEAYRALRVRDYGRVDLRVTETGDIYVLEVNASCYLEQSSELAMAAEAAGIPYTDLIGRIVANARERYGK